MELFPGINKIIDMKTRLALTGHKSSYCLLSPEEVPGVSGRVSY